MFLKYWQLIYFIKKTKTQQFQQRTSASHQFATSGIGVGNRDGGCKFWKMFWILIQGLESKSVQKQADLWGDRSSRGPKLLRGESELLWGMGTRPVTHPLVHLVGRHSLRAYYVPRAVQTRKEAVGKTDKTLALEEYTFFFLFRRKMRSGTISIAFSKGSNRPKFTLFNSSPIPFIENHTGLATWT